MDIIVDKATDVVELVVSRHGIIHGLERFRNRRVKVVVLENEITPLSENPHSGEAVHETRVYEPSEILGDAHSMGEPSYLPDAPADTISLMRDFVTS